ncbi:MAG TPA: hypothetical protein VIH91_02270 [Terriglobales bacterium]
MPILLLAGCLYAQQPPQNQGSGGAWRFAVSGDSRNCGDIVMPAIAQGVRRDGASFYWHLGDYRAIFTFDEDYLHTHPASTISDYMANAWPDFISHQLLPFADTPVFLGLGNHELISPKTRTDYTIQFADWLDKPVLQTQRLADNPNDHMLHTYNHWIDRGVNFITLDNASADEFDSAQMSWLTGVLQRAADNPAVKTLVLGMHAPLADSLAAGHGMNDSAQGQVTGRQVYSSLVAFRKKSGKNVYVLASHSHLVLNNIYATACHAKDEVLPGWIIGSAGAIRYQLPKEHAASDIALANVYGYLLGTVSPDGTIQFEFKQVNEADIPPSVTKEFSSEQVHWCFEKNTSKYEVGGPACSNTTGAESRH